MLIVLYNLFPKYIYKKNHSGKCANTDFTLVVEN